MHNQILCVSDLLGAKGPRGCVWKRTGLGNPGLETRKVRKKGEQKAGREERKGGRGQAGGYAGEKRRLVLPREGAKSSVSITLSQLTQLFSCSKCPLICLHYLLSANHFSTCQLVP